MNHQFDELTKGLAQSVTRRGALNKFGVGLAGMALAYLGLATKAEAGPQWCDPSVSCCCKDCKTFVPSKHPNHATCKNICSSGFGCGPGKPRFP